MNLALLLPAGLAALVALLLPLLLHLARRSEQRITDFAALRWLASKPQPRRKRRFEEWPLLAIRLLLVAALALLLTRPVVFGQPDRRPWIVAMPGVDAAVAQRTTGATHARLHWLAAGFPALDHAPPRGPQPFASLLRELDATLPAGTPLTVLVPDVIDGADAQRPLLSRRVNWRVVPGVTAATSPTMTAAAMTAVIPRIAVRDASDGDAALRYLHAADAAWRVTASTTTTATVKAGVTNAAPAIGMQFAPWAQPLAADARNLVWLAPGPLPERIRDWVANGGQALLDSRTVIPGLADATPLWRDATGDALVRCQALGRGRLMQFTRVLSPEAMPQLLEADFPQHLRALFAAPAPEPTRVSATAYAPLTGAAPYPETPRPLWPWLAALIAALFVVERWLAGSPRRGAQS